MISSGTITQSIMTNAQL